MKRLLLIFIAIAVSSLSFGQPSGGKYSPSANRTWTGLVSSDWYVIGNWNPVIPPSFPSSLDNIVIPPLSGATFYPVIPNIASSNFVGTNNLNIQAGATLTVLGGGSLTVDGKLTISGTLDIESQGSLITNGTVSGKATIKRYINNDNKWHFLSSPVSGQKICNGIFAPTFPGTFPGNITTWDLYNWLPNCPTPPGENWRNLRNPAGPDVNLPNTVDFPLLAFADSRGYLVSYGNSWGTTKTFFGPPNTADRVLAFYDLVAECSWALPGNPFPSAVDWDQVLDKDNLVKGYYYVWNENRVVASVVTPGYEFWKDATFNSNPPSGPAMINGLIPSMQGFFIQVDVTKGKFLTIPNTARVHDNLTDNWLKETPANKLSIIIGNGTSFDDAFVMFTNNSTVGNDGNDAEKLFSMNTDVPQVYTIVNNDLKAALNCLPYVTNGTTVPVGFIAPTEGNYSIRVNGIESFTSLSGLTLEDLKLNYTQNLLQNPVYNFTASGNEDAGRFLLHFAGTIGIGEKANNSTINIYSNEKTVFINCTAGFHNAQVTVSNLLGQEILTQKLNDQTMNQVNVNALKGYYIVKVQDDSSVKTAKVYIN